jgi:predicted nicotinamide N-methyase
MLRNIFGVHSESDSDVSDHEELEGSSGGGSHGADGEEELRAGGVCGATGAQVVHKFLDQAKAPIVLKQSPERGIAHQLWPAASFLCNYIEENAEQLNISTTACLELGAGIGLCGIFMAKLGSPRVVITDLAEALGTIGENITLNGVEHTAVAQELCWGNQTHARQAMEALDGSIPLVIAADCVYWECLYAPLLDTLRVLVVDYGCTVIMSHVRRWKKDGKFFSSCRKYMNVDTVVEIVDKETDVDRVVRRVRRIYKMTRK